ncbi:ribonuclease III family protein [Promethearchaeum syntrophicum]|uniref:Ribonuclease III family protein n=1 Tax=Promethearchaeum syntrophicum TaxID=2594042 RepID=A0A5B9DFF2_9ARCH|nr:ribonuclease III domain-containing protein [Candidatus Prometheoarchaeum syntrophicum]QEE17854.1 ribonuclease III [Candidatus Prometheoarchaeum syntrophicum]
MKLRRKEQLVEFIEKYKLPITVEWLNIATTHDSYHIINPVTPSNERLEALGDSVLDLLSFDWLYDHFQGNEGTYTQLRSEIVSNSVLGKLGKKIGLNSLILKGEGVSIHDKQLADAIEAIFGSIFKYNQEIGFNSYDFCKQSFEFLFHDILKDMKNRDYVPNLTNKNQNNPKNQLSEYILKNKLPSSTLKLISEMGPPHKKVFTSQYSIQLSSHSIISAKGEASTIKQSEKIAAKKLLKRLKYQKQDPKY